MTWGYNDKYGKVDYSTHLTFTANKNKIQEMVHNQINPIDGTSISITELSLQEAGGVYLREGYSMSDVFTTGILQRGRDGKLVEQANGYQVDRSSVFAWALPIPTSPWDGAMISVTRTSRWV